MTLKSPFVPLAVILLSLGQLIVTGWNATSILAGNLPNPKASSGIRLVDLLHQTSEIGRVYELTFERPATGPTVLRTDARLKVQLWSKGRTRILVIRPVGSDPSRWQAFLDLFRGRGKLQIVADRKWVDLGPLPPDGAPLRIQVTGLLPGPFGFAELNKLASPVFEAIRIERPDGPPGVTPSSVPRYRLTVQAPVDARETLARFFFFVSISRALQISGVSALVLLFVGWRLLGKEMVTGAVCCLIPSVVLLHAVCLPPLQGADETSHGATIEALLFRGMPVRESDPYPRSWSLVAEWLEQDRVQYQPDEPLPIETHAERITLARRLREGLRGEASETAPPAPAAAVQGVNSRSPLYFRPFELVGSLLRPMPILERISAYRILSILSGLAFFVVGALLLHRSGVGAGVVLIHGLVWLVPYMVFTVASISNYATAIGLGSLFAASAVVLVLSEEDSSKRLAALTLVAGSWLGVPVWPDFVFLAPVATVAVAIGAVFSMTKRLRPTLRRFWRIAILVSGAASLLLLALLLPRTQAGNIGTRMPLGMPRHFDRSVFWMNVACIAPTILAGLLAFGVVRLSRLPADRQRRLLAGVSVALALLIILGFLLTPWTSIPYETDRYYFSRLIREGIKVALSNSLSWDQDILFWKFFWGAGGWHDLFLPDGLYALGRWLFVFVIVTFPLLAARAIHKRPQHVAALLLVSGVVASFCAATLTLRYLYPGNPWGRFILPWLPLLVSPLLAIALEGYKRPFLDTALRIGVLLCLWMTIAPTGARYVLGLY